MPARSSVHLDNVAADWRKRLVGRCFHANRLAPNTYKITATATAIMGQASGSCNKLAASASPKKGRRSCDGIANHVGSLSFAARGVRVESRWHKPFDLTEVEMMFSGIDLHSNNTVVVVSDAEDRIVLQRGLPNKLGVKNWIITS
jgi:hypothetical protein